MKKLSLIFYKVAKILAVILLVCFAVAGCAMLISGIVYAATGTGAIIDGDPGDPEFYIYLAETFGPAFAMIFSGIVYLTCGVIGQVLVLVFTKRGSAKLEAGEDFKSQIPGIVVGAIFNGSFLIAASIVGLIYLKKNPNGEEAEAATESAPAEEEVLEAEVVEERE